MIIVRLLFVFAALSVGASLLAWLLTGNVRYRHWAWNITRGALAAIVAVLLLFALERTFF
ncbi:hypothetical protein [Pseudothauera lacus]|uniref:Uncharacterized protein n=1 Tax=Pseudothauera lacus TaxID=2136175 RepID=A0A2T4ID08_9RHOO|nr:hypothetical protein [Pseudothauera lacus]PTD95662.1 hypothetical protein C8261_13140 [Pseudothauera lacus]